LGGGEGVKSWTDTYQTKREGKNAVTKALNSIEAYSISAVLEIWKFIRMEAVFYEHSKHINKIKRMLNTLKNQSV